MFKTGEDKYVAKEQKHHMQKERKPEHLGGLRLTLNRKTSHQGQLQSSEGNSSKNYNHNTSQTINQI